MPLYRGSCLCGKVRYVIDGELGPIVYCHCSMCRKAQGSAYATNAPVDASTFHVASGADALTDYATPDGKHRVFCRHCGSPLISRLDSDPDTVRIRIGTLDTPIAARPVAHIYATSKAEWDTILDDLPQYQGREPDRD